MSIATFDRDSMARWYAERHLASDPGTQRIYYLPTDAPDREIRFLEVNDQMAIREADPLDPFDLGVDTDTENAHKLVILDVTPDQWRKIEAREIRMPEDWTLEGKIQYTR